MDEITGRINRNINLIHTFIKLIKKEVRKMSAIGDAIQAFAVQIDTAMDEIATDIQGLQAKIEELIANGGTPEEVAQLLQPLLDKANAIKGLYP